MQGKRKHRSQPLAAKAFQLVKRLWVFTCVAFCFSLLAASSVSKPVSVAHHVYHAASACTGKDQWNAQASASALWSDWENDSDDWEESLPTEDGSSVSLLAAETFVPLKVVAPTQPYRTAVPLFVLFHAWKDHLF